MPGVEPVGETAAASPVKRVCALLTPACAAAVLYGWAAWSFGSLSAPPGAVAVTGGAVLLGGALVVYLRLVGGATGCFGAFALAATLLLSVAVADQSASRDKAVTCVIGKVTEERQKGFGDGDVEITVYHHALRCPGGYPDSLTKRKRLGAKGGTIRVTFDSARRVAPDVNGESSPWPFALLAVLLLAAATEGARRAS